MVETERKMQEIEHTAQSKEDSPQVPKLFKGKCMIDTLKIVCFPKVFAMF